MNLKPILLTMAFAAVIAMGSSHSWAQDSGLVKQTTSAGIEYVYGGVGEGPQNSMEAIRKDYNFRLTFARPHSGEYLADVKVTVENVKSHEKTIDVVSGGPLFYAQLPDGKYKVTAAFEGKEQIKTLTIHKNQPRGIVYYFDK
jgi:hypothetical protein